MKSLLVVVASLCSLLLAAAPRAQAGVHQVEVSLRALDERGQPIAGAGVAVAEWPTAEAALREPLATSDEDGQLRFRVTIPAGISTGTLLLAAPGRACFRYQLWRTPYPLSAVTSPRLDIGDVRLPRGHTMTGRVRDADGAPVAGARVTALDHLATTPLFRAYASQTRTDERGVFVLRGATGQAMSLEVRADGYYEQTLDGVRPGTPLDLTLATSGYYAGEVVGATGQPFEGYLRRSSEYFDFDLDLFPVRGGAFRVPVWTRARCRLTLHDRALQVAGESALLHAPDEQLKIEQRPLEDSEVFLVRVEDRESGEPVRAFRASSTWLADELEPWMKQILLSSMQDAGADGAVRMQPDDFSGSNKLILVMSDGYAPLLHRETAFRRGEDFVAKLARGAAVSGRLVDEATGAPMAGVVVEAKAPGMQLPVATTTDADGRFRLSDVPAGRCPLTAQHPDGTVQAKEVVKLTAGGAVEDVVLTMPKGVSVRGRLRGDYAAAADWRVTLADSEHVPLQGFGYDTGDPAPPTARLIDGAFVLPRRARATHTLYLIVPAPPRCGDALWIPLEEVHVRREDVEVDLDVSALVPGELHGKVTVRGAPLPMDRVAVFAIDGDGTTSGSCPVEPDGSYRLVLPAGTHDLVVVDPVTGVVLRAPDGPAEIAANAQRRRDLEVPLATLHVRFDSDADYVPAQGIEVRAEDGDGATAASLPFTLLGGTQQGHAGVALSGSNRAATLFVPPGTHSLVVHHGADMIHEGIVTYSARAEDHGPMTLGEGAVATKVLPVPEAPHIRIE